MATNPRIVEEFETGRRLGETASTTLPGTQRDIKAQLIEWALALLGDRALVWAGVLGGGGCWAYAMLHPDTPRLVAASLYCATILVPILVRDLKAR